MYPKDLSGEELGSCRIPSSRGVQTKTFSFLLLKQVKYEVTFEMVWAGLNQFDPV